MKLLHIAYFLITNNKIKNYLFFLSIVKKIFFDLSYAIIKKRYIINNVTNQFDFKRNKVIFFYYNRKLKIELKKK